MTDVNLSTRRNNLVTFMTRIVIALLLWICLIAAGLFLFITEENNKKILADQRVELMMEQLNELQLEALNLFIYTSNIIPQDLESVNDLTEKEQILQSRLMSELDAMTQIYQEIEDFPSIILDIETLLNSRSLKQKTKIIEMFQERLALARTVLHEFKWLKKQEYLVSFQLFQRLVVVSALVTLFAVFLAFVMVRKRLNLGLETVLNLVKKYNHKQYSFAPEWLHNDEFREIFFHLQQLKESSLVGASVVSRDKYLLAHHFQNQQEPSIVLNADRRFVLCNKLFELIWSEYQVELESSLCDQENPSLDLSEIRINEIEGNDSLPHLFRFNGLAYSLTEEKVFDEARLIGYVLTFSPVSEELEYEAVTKLVALMASDVWNAPVRVMREGSRIGALAEQLEKIRLSVMNLVNLFDGMTLNDEPQKINSLKDISELVIALSESLNDLQSQLSDQKAQQVQPLVEEDVLDAELEELDFDPLREAIANLRGNVEASIFQGAQTQSHNNQLIQDLESNLLLGYENLNQSLTIVYKEMESSVAAMQESFDCMSEVKVALLNAILSKEGESVDVEALQGFAIDLSHDMDTVSQMLQASLLQEKSVLAKLEEDVESCLNRSEQAKSRMLAFDEKNKEAEQTSQSESMMKDVFYLDDALDSLIKKSKS